MGSMGYSINTGNPSSSGMEFGKSTGGNPGSMLNSGLAQQSDQQGLGNPSIGMPYGPGYTDPNQPGPGDQSIGMPAGPGYMDSSSGGKGGMPQTQTPGFEPQFNFGQPTIGMPAGPGYMQPKQAFNPNPNPVSNMGGGQLPTIGMPAGPGYMQPTGGAQFPGTKPMIDPQLSIPQPQSMEQIRQQVGLRTNPVQSKSVTIPTGTGSNSTFAQRQKVQPFRTTQRRR